MTHLFSFSKPVFFVPLFSTFGFSTDKVENRYKWVLHSSNKDNKPSNEDSSPEDRENRVSSIMKRILKVFEEVHKGRMDEVRIPTEKYIYGIPKWLVDFYPKFKHIIHSKKVSIDDVKYNYKKNPLSQLIMEIAGFSQHYDFGDELLEKVVHYLARLIEKFKFFNRSKFMKDRLQGNLGSNRDYLISSLQIFLSDCEFLREDLLKEKEIYFHRLLSLFFVQQYINLIRYQYCHGLIDEEDLEESLKKVLNNRNETEPAKKKKGRKKKEDFPFYYNYDPDSFEEPEDTFQHLFEKYEESKQLFENEDENEEENEDPFDNYDESYDDSDFNSPFVFDDQKYLLKNRHEYYIHDQEEYLEKTKYFHHKEYKKINKIKKKKQKESHESQSSLNHQDSDHKTDKKEETKNYEKTDKKDETENENQERTQTLQRTKNLHGNDKKEEIHNLQGTQTIEGTQPCDPIQNRERIQKNDYDENAEGNDNYEQTEKKDYDHNEEGTNEEEIQNLQEQEVTQTYGHLWVQCENCYGLNYKKYFFLTKLNVCEHCGYHLKMSSSERIELLIDQGTWNAMHENMNSTDPIEFDRNPTKIKDLPESEKLIQISGIPIIIPNINIPKGAVHQKNEHVCYCKSNCNYCKCRRHCNKKNCSHYYTEHSELQNDFTCPLPCNFDNNQNHSGCHCECNQKNCKHSIIHCCICSCESNPQNGIDLGQNGAVVKDFKILNDLDTSSKPKNSDSFNEYSHMDTKSKDNKNPIAFDSTNNSNSRSDSEDAESEGGNSSEDAESEGGNSKSGYIDNISECEEKGYKDRIDSYQVDTGLTEAVQTGTGELNGIPVAMGVMDFQFMGGSMGSAVGEKITRLIEYATKNSLPLLLVCASGGARMQEGSLSLMQMAKISAALHKYQTNEELLYISILTSPTTGGVTASFGMLGDINISEPNADIGFAGKRVMEQTLNQTVPEDLQKAENFFQKGLLDLIVPRDHFKNLISELLKLHAKFF